MFSLQRSFQSLLARRQIIAWSLAVASFFLGHGHVPAQSRPPLPIDQFNPTLTSPTGSTSGSTGSGRNTTPRRSSVTTPP